MEGKLWPGGPEFSSYTGDAACKLPEKNKDSIKWDFFYTDYPPDFWQQFPSTGEHVWLNWHGTHQYAAVSSLSGNFLLKSEHESGSKAKAAMFETTYGRGIYTSPNFEKARHTVLHI